MCVICMYNYINWPNFTREASGKRETENQNQAEENDIQEKYTDHFNISNSPGYLNR